MKIWNKLSLLMIATLLVHSVSGQDSLNITKLSQWKIESVLTYNEVWGIAQDGREYAVIGTLKGTYFIDVTDPSTPVMVDYVPGKDESCFCIHRDYHDYNGYLYMVTDEEPGSLQIVDLSSLPDSVSLVYDSDALFTRSHNIFIDSTSALMYSAGGSPNSGIGVYSLINPTNPVLLNDFATPAGIHDIYVRNDTVYAHGGQSGMFVYNFANVGSPQLIGTYSNYVNASVFNHSGWLNKQGNVYVFADETTNQDIKVIDVTDLTDIQPLDNVNTGGDSNAIAHNPIIKGDFAYVSYYLDGLWIYDISNPTNTTVAGYYDLYVGAGDTVTGGGAWGVYPFLPSGNILISDMNSGLFVFDATNAITGIESIKQEKLKMNIAPNPFTDQVKITFEEQVKVSTIKIIDIAGRIVSTSEKGYFGQSIEYAVDDLKAGQYFIHITTDKGNFVGNITKAVQSHE